MRDRHAQALGTLALARVTKAPRSPPAPTGEVDSNDDPGRCSLSSL